MKYKPCPIHVIYSLHPASTASNIGVDRAGVSGAAVAGGLIALAVALILIALAILFAAWVIKNKNSARGSHLLE